MYSLRYTPQAVYDMDSVWDEAYEASQSPDIADKYIKDFAEVIRIIYGKRDYMQVLFPDKQI